MLQRYIIKIEEEKEYYEDGTLKYECFWGVIQKGYKHLFDNRRDFKVKEDGHWRVRLNHATKYKRNGEIEWRHIYNDKGKVIQIVSFIK